MNNRITIARNTMATLFDSHGGSCCATRKEVEQYLARVRKASYQSSDDRARLLRRMAYPLESIVVQTRKPVAGKVAVARRLPTLKAVFDPYKALRGAHAAVAVTEREEKCSLELKRVAALMEKPEVLVDGRSVLSPRRQTPHDTPTDYMGVAGWVEPDAAALVREGTHYTAPPGGAWRCCNRPLVGLALANGPEKVPKRVRKIEILGEPRYGKAHEATVKRTKTGRGHAWESVRCLVLERESVSLVVVCLGLSVAILVVVWRVWGTTDRVEQDGKERLEHLREERRVLLEQLVGLREQKERLQWLREGRAEVTAAGIRYMGFGRGYGLSPARTHEEVGAS